MLQPSLLLLKSEHSSLRTNLAPFCNDATVSLDQVQRGEKVLHLVQQKQITGGRDRLYRVVRIKEKHIH